MSATSNKLCLSIDKDLHARLMAAAKRDGTTASKIIAGILVVELDRRDALAPRRAKKAAAAAPKSPPANDAPLPAPDRWQRD